MDILFEMLFLAWCPPYEPDKAPDYLKNDPVRAYGQYAFREGFQLGLSLAVASLAEWTEQKSGAGA